MRGVGSAECDGALCAIGMSMSPTLLRAPLLGILCGYMQLFMVMKTEKECEKEMHNLLYENKKNALCFTPYVNV
jgi:hypothetical protein